MQFLIVAYDGTDAEAPARRAAVRPAHLEEAKARFEGGRMALGGAILDAEARMVGSAMLIEAEDEAEARSVIENDVYYRTGVWVRYDLWPFKRAF